MLTFTSTLLPERNALQVDVANNLMHSASIVAIPRFELPEKSFLAYLSAPTVKANHSNWIWSDRFSAPYSYLSLGGDGVLRTRAISIKGKFGLRFVPWDIDKSRVLADYLERVYLAIESEGSAVYMEIFKR